MQKPKLERILNDQSNESISKVLLSDIVYEKQQIFQLLTIMKVLK